jgi:hypothetical protein
MLLETVESVHLEEVDLQAYPIRKVTGDYLSIIRTGNESYAMPLSHAHSQMPSNLLLGEPFRVAGVGDHYDPQDET